MNQNLEFLLSVSFMNNLAWYLIHCKLKWTKKHIKKKLRSEEYKVKTWIRLTFLNFDLLGWQVTTTRQMEGIKGLYIPKTQKKKKNLTYLKSAKEHLYLLYIHLAWLKNIRRCHSLEHLTFLHTIKKKKREKPKINLNGKIANFFAKFKQRINLYAKA